MGDCGADLVCVGHAHTPLDVVVSGTRRGAPVRVVNAGSVRNPASRDTRASDALLEADRCGWPNHLITQPPNCPKGDKMRYGDLTYLEIRERAAAGCLAVVPTGCTEQQGPHLPVDFDTWLAETVCLGGAQRAAERYGVRALVLPALPFGPTPEHRAYGSGYLHLPQALHEAVVSSVLASLAEQGFGRIVVWRGCGGHELGETVARFNAAHAGRCSAVLPELPYHEIWCRVGDAAVPGGHADSFATSLALYLRPASVRRALIADPHSAPVDWDDPELDFGHYSASGVIGDPTRASAALGRRLWGAVLERVAGMLREIAGDSTPACRATR